MGCSLVAESRKDLVIQLAFLHSGLPSSLALYLAPIHLVVVASQQ